MPEPVCGSLPQYRFARTIGVEQHVSCRRNCPDVQRSECAGCPAIDKCEIGVFEFEKIPGPFIWIEQVEPSANIGDSPVKLRVLNVGRLGKGHAVGIAECPIESDIAGQT